MKHNGKCKSPSPRGPHLASFAEVRRELARLYREARTGRVDIRDASRLAYLLRQIADILPAVEKERQRGSTPSRAEMEAIRDRYEHLSDEELQEKLAEAAERIDAIRLSD